jgi:large subunit ribosomal protein L6
MSRIGKQPIVLPQAVQVRLRDAEVESKGAMGVLTQALPGGISAQQEGQQLVLERRNDTKEQRALHGLCRSLLANAVQGVTEGFTKKLEIHGVGYRAQLEGKAVVFSLGYTHPIKFPVPPGITVTIERNVLTVTGIDKQQVGQVAADIRALRPPDVYKLKGIRYQNERLRKKAGKTGAA